MVVCVIYEADIGTILESIDKDRVVPLTHEAVEMLRRHRDATLIESPFVFPGMKGRMSQGKINARLKGTRRPAASTGRE